MLAMIGALAGGPATWAADAFPRAKVETGALIGRAADGVIAFKGIPFAAPPVGPLRWHPPQPAVAWPGERDAASFGPGCLQVPPAAGTVGYGAVVDPYSEDCLTLNVWAPAAAAKPAPVMVWVYGGGFHWGGGSHPTYDGAALAAKGVVVVTINYRVGRFGFFAHPALTREAGADEPLGNYGLMDQVAALKWVRRNIKSFGGDPANVTVFGESAGGASIVALLTIPAARGAFDKAIVESGGGWTRMRSLAQMEQAGVKAAMGARDARATSGLPANATAEQLRRIPSYYLLDSSLEGPGLVLDGRFVRENPSNAFANGHAMDVPLIIGSNSGESSLMASTARGGGAPTAQELAAAEARKAELAAARGAYGAMDDDLLARELFTDRSGAAARWVARQTSSGAPSYQYFFSYVDERKRDTLKVARHAAEVPYVMGTLDHSFWGGEVTAADRRLSAAMQGCWVAFAATGVPCGPGQWPAVTPTRDVLMEFGEGGPQLQQAFRKARYDLQERKALPEVLGAAQQSATAGP